MHKRKYLLSKQITREMMKEKGYRFISETEGKIGFVNTLICPTGIVMFESHKTRMAYDGSSWGYIGSQCNITYDARNPKPTTKSIPEEAYEALAALTKEQLINITRDQYHMPDGITFDVVEFDVHALCHSSYIEIEVDEASNGWEDQIPDWFGIDITNDYTRNPYIHWMITREGVCTTDFPVEYMHSYPILNGAYDYPFFNEECDE